MSPSRKIKEIRANRFVLEDPTGRTRALLQAMPDGTAFIDLFGADSASLSLCIDSDGNPKIGFKNKKGRHVISIGVSDNEGQGIQLSDSEGRPVCFIFTAQDGIPRIKLFQIISPKKGKVLWSTPGPKTNNRKATTKRSRRK